MLQLLEVLLVILTIGAAATGSIANNEKYKRKIKDIFFSFLNLFLFGPAAACGGCGGGVVLWFILLLLLLLLLPLCSSILLLVLLIYLFHPLVRPPFSVLYILLVCCSCCCSFYTCCSCFDISNNFLFCRFPAAARLVL